MNLYQTNQNNHPNAIPSNPFKYLYIEYVSQICPEHCLFVIFLWHQEVKKIEWSKYLEKSTIF